MLSIAEWTDRALALSSPMKLTSSASFSPSIRISLRLKSHRAQAKNFCRVLDIRVTEIVESDAGQPRAFQHSLQHMQHAVRGHRASGGGREYPFAVPNFAFLHFQNAYRVCRQRQCAVGVFRFQWGFYHLAVLPGNGPLDFQYATVEVDVRPL